MYRRRGRDHWSLPGSFGRCGGVARIETSEFLIGTTDPAARHQHGPQALRQPLFGHLSQAARAAGAAPSGSRRGRWGFPGWFPRIASGPQGTRSIKNHNGLLLLLVHPDAVPYSHPPRGVRRGGPGRSRGSGGLPPRRAGVRRRRPHDGLGAPHGSESSSRRGPRPTGSGPVFGPGSGPVEPSPDHSGLPQAAHCHRPCWPR